MENIIRIASMVMLLSTAVISQSCTSPTTRCDCFQKDGKTIINCRYKNLTAIPTFTITNQVYDEIRFTSFEETGTCQPFAGCNNIRQIGANAFANLKVKKIDLLNNPVTSIDNYAFEGLAPEIESISLEGDGSNGMPDQALAALDEQLKTLHLENYGDTSIEAPIVFPFPHLESLTIKKWKNLKSINADIFGVMKDLKELKLISLRDITILPVPAIQKFLNLTSLDIMDIGITSIDGDSFTPMSLLKDIKIRNNIHLNTIDQRTFSGVTDTVEFLEIDNNNLNNKLSLEFLRNENWTVLSHLNIGYNFYLRDLPSEIFSKTPALAYLQCQDIGLTSINKDMFSGLVSLHTLDLAYNNIKTITPQTFKNSPSLVELRLHDQQSIDYLDIQNNAFSGIETSLEMLSLQNNKLNVSQFWMDLSTLTNLLVLEVDNTGIENIPDRAFRNNVKLTNLHIADNNINSLKQETFFGPRDTLQTININRNKIQTVDQCTLSDFPVRPKLTLVGNPLNCNCDLAWLYDWFKLQSNQETVARQEIGQCASPVSLTNKYFTEFNKNEMCPTGATIRNCPDIYLTTTTKTTTSRTTTTTTPIRTTPPLPEFEILINNRASTFIEVTWVINDRTHVTGLKLEMISNYQATKEAYPGLDAKSHTFYQLREDTTFTFCLVLKIENEYRDTQPKCKSTTTLPPLTDTPSSTTTVAPEQSSQLGIIIGSSVGGVVLVALIIAILVILLRSNKPKKQKPLPEPVSFSMKADVPHAGGTAKRFAKKAEKEGASPDDISVTVISNGDINNQSRISAGSYQALNEKGVDSRPMPSSYGHYTNDIGDRPLPNAPRGATGHGYVNSGFKNSADHLPETSKNDYSEVRY
ncbi:leucine-rich repeat-containing protein 4-like [Ruditapes philippinarum]|uniref:leucine-rich repeat-containing protein 4-like n=1 Tax=Ruditapes philippinarum TaxID=129788 RepID=UPI00295A6902|nr:leucine-rich repeat-containing protein 4-like [Ruditapes philippinarum]XP_060577932.1 leucine-rich repeat-containing protein 4-like [Ruditapes philippinarum]